eukprot:Gb_27971 [translate_table: standard]
MGIPCRCKRFALLICAFGGLIQVATAVDIYLNWHVTYNSSINPLDVTQPVIAINGKFPGPLLNATTNDNIRVNILNSLDEPFLMTWNGIQQRLNSWQDGVSGTNCPIPPGSNWTYNFQLKDQIGSFIYFPSTRFQKAAGGFGPIRVNNRAVIDVPFDPPADDFNVLIGDWYTTGHKDLRVTLDQGSKLGEPDGILFNGKPPYDNRYKQSNYESFKVTPGSTYRFRVSNVGIATSLNFRIQGHTIVLVETEGSYVDQIQLDSLDIHVGQSYSVLVTANQNPGDYYIVASPRFANTARVGVAVLHYYNSTTPANGPLPIGPDADPNFSINQAKSIKWNMTVGAARPNRQGAFNVTNVTIAQTFVFQNTVADINGTLRYTINNVSYLTPVTPLKLADYYNKGSGLYMLDNFPFNVTSQNAVMETSVISGKHKGWAEIVFINNGTEIQSWHLDGYGFYVVGFGQGDWSADSIYNYNLYDPVVRSTTQVFPNNSWTAIYVHLDNPGMWNLRSQTLTNWYLGQELYVRVFDTDPNPAKEHPIPDNVLYCGAVKEPKINRTDDRPSSSPSPDAKRNAASICGRHLAFYDAFWGSILLVISLAWGLS